MKSLSGSEELRIVSERNRNGKSLKTVLDMATGVVRNDPVPGNETLAGFHSKDHRIEKKSARRPGGRQISGNCCKARRLIKRFGNVTGIPHHSTAAQETTVLIERHCRGQFRNGKINRIFREMARHIEETRTANKIKTPREIDGHIARQWASGT